MNPTATNSWRALKKHASGMNNVHMREMFADDHRRADKYSIRLDGLLFDYSKNIINDATLELLAKFCGEMEFEKWRAEMFNGKKINLTEKRAVLHTALRNLANLPVEVDGVDIMPSIKSEFNKLAGFVSKLRDGTWRGFSGKRINDIVNIGIGGSHLGPQMACHALFPYAHESLRFHFLSNVDGMSYLRLVKKLNPETTLFIVASKTFSTLETMTNAGSCRTWFLENGGNEKDIFRHFAAVSANGKEAEKFGIAPDNVFTMWNWVGGRFSIWSAIGLPIMLAVGMDNFNEMLAGAFAMDKHFQHAPLLENIPVIMALIGIWYNNFMDAQTCAVLPYCEQLEFLPPYLQQLDMESNGKSINRDGKRTDYATAPVLWGSQGINGQHAFYQLIHQSEKLIPCDFIGVGEPVEKIGRHHDILFANFIGQTEALMQGRTEADAPHRLFAGNNPSNSIVVKRLDPYSFGMLIAIYEHKVFTQGIAWNLNSFDQWGVELGKELAGKILHDFADFSGGHDSSTNSLISAYLNRSKWTEK